MKLFVCIALLAVGSAFAEELSAEGKSVLLKIKELKKQEESLLDTLPEDQSDVVKETLLAHADKDLAQLEAETSQDTEIARVKRGAKQSRSVRARRARRARNLRKHRQNVRLRNIRRQRNLRRHANGVRLRNARRQRNLRRHANGVRLRNARRQRNLRRFRQVQNRRHRG